MAHVQCPSCNGSYHETTELYNPDTAPNGAMFRLKPEYVSNGWSSFPEDTSTIGDNLYCPECSNSYCEGNPARVRVVGWKKRKK
jgi:hypothetical protein